MKVTIQHHNSKLAAVCILSLAFIMITFLIPSQEVRTVLEIISGIALGVSCLLMLLSAALQTTVTVENNILTVNFGFITYEIQIDDITALSFSHTKQMIKGHNEYRVNLDISVNKNNTVRTISLNDNATVYHNHITSDDEQIPDEEIPLYKVYLCLAEKTGL